MDINLQRHNVVEASAGTGKTYTIEQIVRRLLVEESVDFEKILLVTFTEKATGELRERLRTMLDSALENYPNHRQRLQRALDNFDRAPICTIHGFCHRLLSEYALEQGQDLRWQRVDDGDLTTEALREVQRRHWVGGFGSQLADILSLAAYNSDQADKWDRDVGALVAKYHREMEHSLRPQPMPGAWDQQRQEKACLELLEKLRRCAGALPADHLTHPWYVRVSQVKFLPGTKNKRLQKYLVPLLLWLADPTTRTRPLASYLGFRELIHGYFDEFQEHGFAAFFAKIKAPAVQEIKTQCPELVRAIDLLEQYRQAQSGYAYPKLLAVQTVEAVRRCLNEIKAQRGLISFDDMIVGVFRAVMADDDGARTFRKIVAKRFCYAIVDEFQDTDPLQWQIFRLLFLEGDGTKLIVVGDPKQAIYGFRGADLPTYRAAVTYMEEASHDKPHRLVDNWRTVPELLAPVNQLFKEGGFFPPDSFQKTKTPDEGIPWRVVSKEAEGAPFTMVNLSEAKTLKIARRQFAEFAAQEAKRLLSANIVIEHKKEPGALTPRHICMLVFNRNEAAPLADALRKEDLPFTFYKQTGLWDSEEARDIGILLQALAAPDDRPAFRKALLTSFFRLDIEQLAGCHDIPISHPARVQFQKWVGLAAERHWAALTQSLLEDSGILFHDHRQVNLDRRSSNLSYIFSLLAETAYRDNLDLLDLIDVLAKLKQGDRENAFQPIETGEPKIQIMTIHAAKGLEFPVVFLAGGFTGKSKSKDEMVIYHRDSKRIFDLCPNAEAREDCNAEELDNKRRLLYVALTRAIFKLYVPMVDVEMGKGHHGPLSQLLVPALQKSKLEQLGKQHVAVVEYEPSKNREPGRKNPLSTKTTPVSLPKDWFPPADTRLEKRRLQVRSFSSLHQASSRFHYGEEEFEEAPEVEQEQELAEDPWRGPVFGEIVHEVLESIDFEAVSRAASVSELTATDSPLSAAIASTVGSYVSKINSRLPLPQLMAQGCLKTAELVWNGLRTPLAELGCSVAAIPRQERIHELQFLFPQRFDNVPAEVALEEGFLTGFMDLVFVKDGLYCLLDWKTNDLDGYDKPAIDRAMADSDYHRQYRLYLQALERWLRRRHGQDFDFLKRFGGVYYLFLRGMSGSDGSPGIFFHKPTDSDLCLESILNPA